MGTAHIFLETVTGYVKVSDTCQGQSVCALPVHEAASH